MVKFQEHGSDHSASSKFCECQRRNIAVLDAYVSCHYYCFIASACRELEVCGNLHSTENVRFRPALWESKPPDLVVRTQWQTNIAWKSCFGNWTWTEMDESTFTISAKHCCDSRCPSYQDTPRFVVGYQETASDLAWNSALYSAYCSYNAGVRPLLKWWQNCSAKLLSYYEEESKPYCSTTLL